jgi:hypothetical protein
MAIFIYVVLIVVVAVVAVVGFVYVVSGFHNNPLYHSSYSKHSSSMVNLIR